MTHARRTAKGATALLIGLSLLAALPAVPTLGLSKTACRVKNTDTGVTKGSLKSAVKAAGEGDHLTVRGVCHGVTTIGKDLTIRGIRPKGAAKPTLDGDDGGSVVTTLGSGVDVTIAKLRIADGSGTPNTGCLGTCTTGGGIWANGSTLTLRDVVLTANEAGAGGAIAVAVNNIVTLAGTTTVIGNASTVEHGGGAIVYGAPATLAMIDSSRIEDNTSANSGGGIDIEGGTVTMSGSSAVVNNHVGQLGAGVRITYGGTLAMSGTSSIDHNLNTAGNAGGVLVGNGTLTIADLASIHDNSAQSLGGGVLIQMGTFDVVGLCGADKAVHGNSPQDCTDARG